jgi:hypothetical protein
MPITIQEIIASDTISQLVDKTNFNFDQLMLNGGGPAGPIGGPGPTGPAGGRGPKGSTWYDDPNTTVTDPNSIIVSPNLLSGDFYLDFAGDVWEYDGTNWLQGNVDLMGPIGPAGQSGGFGGAFGHPNYLQGENTRYNQPFGYDPSVSGGANTDNEGVASILIGGVPPDAIAVNPLIPLTAAYIVPGPIAGFIASDITSLFLHQKDQAGTSITFHGGGVNAGDKYEQSTFGNLSNIHLSIDDRLVVRSPKSPTTPISQENLIGYQVLTDKRSQSYEAGRAISFSTGSNQDEHWNGQNSNFEIQVGTGETQTNKFKVSTLGASATTTIESGGSIIDLSNTGQVTNVGRFQVLSGLTSFVASDTFAVTSGGDINLKTNVGSIPGSLLGSIALTTQTGNISLSSAGGAIAISQDATGVAGGNVEIQQKSEVGKLLIGSNSSIKLYNIDNVASNPMIQLDYLNGSGNYPQIQNVGWQTTTYATGQPLINIPDATVGHIINPTGSLLVPYNILERVGSFDFGSMLPSTWYRQYTAGANATTLPGGSIGIVMGNESTAGWDTSRGNSFSSPYGGPDDNTLEFTVRDVQNGTTPGANEYITLGRGKLGLAVPLVHKRDHGLNSTKNMSPLNIAPISGNGPTANYVSYGWNTNQSVGPNAISGMPTTDDLNVPFITLGYGPGIPTGNSTITTTRQYNHVFNFPTGSYPGQQLILKVLHFQSAGRVGPSIYDLRTNYGRIRIKIPVTRRRATNYGTGAWNSWYGSTPYTYPLTGSTSNYRLYDTGDTSNAVPAVRGELRETTYHMIWDGGILRQQGMNKQDPFNTSATIITTEVQRGWTIMSTASGYYDEWITLNGGYPVSQSPNDNF